MSTADCNTPSVTAHDARGLPVRQIAYLRTEAGVLPLITRLRHDVVGRPVEQRDPRLAAALKPNLATVYGLTGQSVKVASVDAGVRTILLGPAGEIRQRWDGRGNHWRSTYDHQLRVLTLELNDQPDIETFTYATTLADPAHNLRGQLIKQVDPSGEFEIKSVSLHGQPLLDTRTITEAGKLTSSRTYSPLGAVLTHTDAGGHQQRMRYDSAGQLQQVQLRLDPTAQWTPVLEDARYNAAGQIIEQLAGNKMLSTWTYDDADGRLHALVAGVPGQDPLQHFKYQYDGVGNVLRIDDLTFKPVFFKNQLIDGHRKFEYNSLYQMISATGHDAAPSSDLPGRPLPSDPKNHLNYKQMFVYDDGGNLIRLTHERAVGGCTHPMCMDPNSNRGVRWKEGDPVPDFDTLFDPHGNLLASAPGRPLQWNSYDQLKSATLVERDNGPNDEEVCRYSQGVRVFKRHQWQASTFTHFHQVIYLPGLEIRTRDNGEELHVITLPGGRGSVRCLHWVSKKPDGIDQDQLRYSVDDHLGSSAMELDQNARLISYEGYYAFGGTAWLTAVFLLEVSYKTCRYSGKEMDECGLYYYGSRYYAPWLCRWVSADPAGPVDGLNFYAFVRNNPLNYFDEEGEELTSAEQRAMVDNYETLLATVESRLDQSIYQLNNLHRTRDIYKSSVKRAVFTGINLIASALTAGVAATAATTATAFTGPAAPLIGIGAAIVAADATGNALDKVAKKNAFGYPLLPRADDFDVDNIVKEATPSGLIDELNSMASKYDVRTTDGQKETAFAAVINTVDTFVSTTHLEKSLAFFRLSTEMTEALNGTLGLRDLDVSNQALGTLSDFLVTQKAMADNALVKLESSKAMHKAEVAGTGHRLGAKEIVVKAKMQRVVDLNHRLAQHIQKQQAA